MNQTQKLFPDPRTCLEQQASLIQRHAADLGQQSRSDLQLFRFPCGTGSRFKNMFRLLLDGTQFILDTIDNKEIKKHGKVGFEPWCIEQKTFQSWFGNDWPEAGIRYALDHLIHGGVYGPEGSAVQYGLKQMTSPGIPIGTDKEHALITNPRYRGLNPTDSGEIQSRSQANQVVIQIFCSVLALARRDDSECSLSPKALSRFFCRHFLACRSQNMSKITMKDLQNNHFLMYTCFIGLITFCVEWLVDKDKDQKTMMMCLTIPRRGELSIETRMVMPELLVPFEQKDFDDVGKSMADTLSKAHKQAEIVEEPGNDEKKKEQEEEAHGGCPLTFSDDEEAKEQTDFKDKEEEQASRENANEDGSCPLTFSDGEETKKEEKKEEKEQRAHCSALLHLFVQVRVVDNKPIFTQRRRGGQQGPKIMSQLVCPYCPGLGFAFEIQDVAPFCQHLLLHRRWAVDREQDRLICLHIQCDCGHSSYPLSEGSMDSVRSHQCARGPYKRCEKCLCLMNETDKMWHVDPWLCSFLCDAARSLTQTRPREGRRPMLLLKWIEFWRDLQPSSLPLSGSQTLSGFLTRAVVQALRERGHLSLQTDKDQTDALLWLASVKWRRSQLMGLLSWAALTLCAASPPLWPNGRDPPGHLLAAMDAVNKHSYRLGRVDPKWENRSAGNIFRGKTDKDIPGLVRFVYASSLPPRSGKSHFQDKRKTFSRRLNDAPPEKSLYIDDREERMLKRRRVVVESTVKKG